MIKRFLFLLIVLMPLCMFGTYAKAKPLTAYVDVAGDEYTDNIEAMILEKQVQIRNGGLLIDKCLQNGRFQQNYTIDRRCYITDEQKKEFPYNAIVRVVSDTGHCTGTLVKDNADNLYVYTAAHCMPDTNAPLTIKLQDGTTFSATPKWNGVGSVKQDVAILEVTSENTKSLPAVKMGQFNSADHFNVVGYGGLAILSDRMIHEIKQNYANHIGVTKDELESKPEIMERFIKFLEKDFGYVIIFGDADNLKGSFDCSLRPLADVVKGKSSSSGREIDCQTSKGVSGGPVFDKNNNLVAVHSSSASAAYMTDRGYAATFLGGQEPVSDVQNQLYNYKLMVYHADHTDRQCYVETNDKNAYWVNKTLCLKEAHAEYDGGSFWMTRKNGKIGKGTSSCFVTGANDFDWNTIPDVRGPYCWCRLNNNDNAYFLGVVYNDEQECRNYCDYACAKRFSGEN